jgi:hypothetical protein
MILPHGHATKYLTDYKDGKIKQGLGVGTDLDHYVRFKPKQVNIILGHDNVGKSYWMFWYFLALSTHYGLRWCILACENGSGQIVRDLIQMYSGVKFKSLSHSEIRRYETIIEGWFVFVDNKLFYTPEQVFALFNEQEGIDGFAIDPFSGLDRGMSHADNYDFMNKARQFVNTNGKTLYVSMHPNTESGRTGMLYPMEHNWKGHLKPPLRSHVEGGKPFLNRCDDMLVIHRLVKHVDMRYSTMVSSEKVKDTETGGALSDLESPVMCDFNSGLGFTIGGKNPIKKLQQKPLAPSMGFDTNTNGKDDLPF